MGIEVNLERGRLRVALSGDLDHHNARNSMEVIKRGIDTNLPAVLEIDLQDVGFADSSAFALLVRSKKLMDELNGKLQVVNVQSQPMKLLNAAKIGRLLEITSTKEAQE
ncbi:MAG: STAS domain-containing protein [Oscillospiraceae bacterium]|jgi:stage II sporulation protein AA (anti-sigma F factor antagonist)|nr:STAS domain-containing protein [Oscillospiraceae bacterium]